jgi:CubicO group peptidase (beta-lactamase class C family)
MTRNRTGSLLLAAAAATLALVAFGAARATASTRASWAPVNAELHSAVTASDTTGLSLRVVYSGRTIYNKAFGTDWTTNTFTPVFSTTKMATVTAIMTLVDEKKLKLTTRVVSVLPWFDASDPAKAAITLGELLSHTSGLPGVPGDAPCITDPTTTLDACVHQVAGLSLIGTPGKVFAYGGNDLQVAALMAQVVSKKPWTTFFNNALVTPCGLNWSWNSTTNPWAAAGGSTDTSSEMEILQIQQTDGLCGHRRILSAASVADMQADHQSGTTINYTPYPGVSHGLGEWRNKVSRHDAAWIISSPGAGGTFPWVDLKHGYRAYLSTSANPLTAYLWSAKVAQALFKLVPAALPKSSR